MEFLSRDDRERVQQGALLLGRDVYDNLDWYRDAAVRLLDELEVQEATLGRLLADLERRKPGVSTHV